MPDLKQYWQDLRAIEGTLDEFVWLMSLENRAKGQTGGTIVEAPATVAAKLLYAKSHRLAIPEEIAAHRAKEDETNRQSFERRLRDKGIALVKVK